MLDCIEIDPRATATASVIWLHGLGADGNDFVPIVDELGLGADHGVRFVFPNAPVRPVAINNGMSMRAWYDITGVELDSGQDAEGIRASAQAIEELIAREHERGVSAERIVLAGFSQGGAIALHAGLRHARPLAGLMGLSTYLPLAETLDAEASAANRGVSILMAHGSQDPMLPIQLGQTSRDRLLEAGYDVAWHEYPMQHQVCLPEIATIGRWLKDRVAP
jgi:phospholipase/carboxylesterase